MTGSNDVRLEVAGTEFDGWTSVEITAGLDRAARDFTLGITDQWPGQAVGLVARRVRMGDACRVWIGGDLVMTGYVDGTPISYDAQSVQLQVKGRSATADLVDCSVTTLPGQWTNRRLEDIARELAAPYNVAVVCAADTGAVIPDHQAQQGETVIASLSRLLGLRQLLATDDAAGRLVVCRAGGERAATSLVTGENILSAGADLDGKDRFRDYFVRGQAAGGDLAFASLVSGLEGKATDSGVTRHRVLVKTADGNADNEMCRKEALWEAAHRAGKSYETTYTVQGWRQGNGRLWLPNQIVHVQDPIIGFDLDLLVGEITYSLSDKGTLAKLKVAPKAAWDLPPAVPAGAVNVQGATMVKFDVPGDGGKAATPARPQVVKF